MNHPTFETLRVWHDARALVRLIFLATRSGGFASDFSFRDQIRRAALSVMSNIAEGHERGGLREFVHFLAIAKGSCGEVRSQLYAAGITCIETMRQDPEVWQPTSHEKSKLSRTHDG